MGGWVARADDPAWRFADDLPILHDDRTVGLVPGAHRLVAQLGRAAREVAIAPDWRGEEPRPEQREPAPSCDQASESAQIVRAQFQAKVPSASLRAADTPPEPFTGCKVVPSHSCTDETRMPSFCDTKL